MLYLKAKAKKHHASHNHVRKIVNNFLWEFKVSDINWFCRYSYNTINGSRGMHQMRSMSTRDPTLIQFKHVSCACVSCVNMNFDTKCELATHVPNWTLIKLEPNDQL